MLKTGTQAVGANATTAKPFNTDIEKEKPHTKGVWFILPYGNPTPNIYEIAIRPSDGGRCRISYNFSPVLHTDPAIILADAHRIAACVNACGDIPTELLETEYQGGKLYNALSDFNDQVFQLRTQRDDLLNALHQISLASQNSMSSQRECGRIARSAIAKNSGKYNEAQIAYELERTAMGDGFYGNALRVAKDIPGVTDADRALLDRYATGQQSGTDHVALQDLALRIDTIAKGGQS